MNNADSFWGDGYEYGANTPVFGLRAPAAPGTPDALEPCTSSSPPRPFGEVVSIGPSLGSDVHFYQTNTTELWSVFGTTGYRNDVIFQES